MRESCSIHFMTDCTVVDGPRKGSSCQFPYVIGRVIYNECNVINATDNRPWCPTEVGFKNIIFLAL